MSRPENAPVGCGPPVFAWPLNRHHRSAWIRKFIFAGQGLCYKTSVTTDFFDRETRAQKLTRRLVWLFALAVLVVLVFSNLLVGSVVFIFIPPSLGDERWATAGVLNTGFYLLGEALTHPWHFLELIGRPLVVACISFGTLASIAAGCYYKIRQLAAGGSTVAELLGGRRVSAGTTDPDEQRLRNVIGEMAIAAGTSVPEVYVLDNERGINSFAAGYTRHDVAIGVTCGCLKLLTRDELQGVAAHEFSHILNGDTRLNMQLIGLAHGLFWPTILGRILLRGSPEPAAPGESLFDEDEAPSYLPTAPLGFLFMAVGSISLPFVRLLKSAICRQREWLADAAAVQFTRNPAGIEGALKKIGGLFKQGRLDSPHAEMASHLYFADCSYAPWLDCLATHPPVDQRILAIDPTFDGSFPKVKMLAPTQYEREQAFDQAAAHAMALERILPEGRLNLNGGATAEHLRQVALMRLHLPPEVGNALHTSTGAAGIVYSLLLSDDRSTRDRQMEILRARLAPDLWAQTKAIAPCIEALGDRYKLVLAEFSVPALRENNLAEHDAFQQTIRQLVECDGYIALFEYTLMKMIARQLLAHFVGAPPEGTQFGCVRDLLPECALLLSALAHVASDDESAARNAFAAGVKFLDAPAAAIQFLSRDQWDLAKVDAALTRLAGYHAPVKRNILLACGRTVIADGQVNVRAAELLRAVADALDCPMPPFIESIRMDELAKED